MPSKNGMGKPKRTWLMDRGIPTEETLELMRKARGQLSGGDSKRQAEQAGVKTS